MLLAVLEDCPPAVCQQDYSGQPVCMQCVALIVAAKLVAMSVSAEHFNHEHYLCEDPICRQEQFRVFATEAELNQHRAKEHGNVMSGYERRQAMRVPIELNVSQLSPLWHLIKPQSMQSILSRFGADCACLRCSTMFPNT